MKKPIRIAGIAINEGYQIPAISKVANATLAAPTKVRVKSLRPNCLNSLMMTSYRKIHT